MVLATGKAIISGNSAFTTPRNRGEPIFKRSGGMAHCFPWLLQQIPKGYVKVVLQVDLPENQDVFQRTKIGVGVELSWPVKYCASLRRRRPSARAIPMTFWG